MSYQSGDFFIEPNRRNRRNQRVSNGANINNYLITIPRCDLPKKYIFDGLSNLCTRLAVSKEKHSVSYQGYCCKDSSVRRNSQPTFERQSNEILNRSAVEPSNRVEQHAQRPESVTASQFERICNGQSIQRTTLNFYKKNPTNNNFDDSVASNLSESQLSVQTEQPLSNENEWEHCKTHIHIFAEFTQEHIVDFEKCKRIMSWCAENYTANVEACKSPRNAIRYVTKEDPKPILKNINAEECSFHKKMIDWIKANPEYNLYDPFICSRPNLYKLITVAHADYYRKFPVQYNPCRGLKTSNLDCNNNQTKYRVQEWFNECIHNWRVKFPALYLWGESNTGKTTLIFDWLLAGQVDDKQIFRPTRNCQFAWADFSPREHCVVVMDEFEFTQFNLEEWKNIIEGRPTAVRVKGKPSKIISLKCPIIMISNYPPIDKSEVTNRIRIVKTEKTVIPDMFINGRS